jgi:hypothetical protein
MIVWLRKKGMLSFSLFPRPPPALTSNESVAQQAWSSRLLRERADALWEGLRRVYFRETEEEVPPIEDGVLADQALRQEISELMARLARRRARPFMALPPPQRRRRDDDPDDPDPWASHSSPGFVPGVSPHLPMGISVHPGLRTPWEFRDQKMMTLRRARIRMMFLPSQCHNSSPPSLPLPLFLAIGMRWLAHLFLIQISVGAL